MGGVSLTLHDSIRVTCRLTSRFSQSTDRLRAATLPAPRTSPGRGVPHGRGQRCVPGATRGNQGAGAGLHPWLGGQMGIVATETKYFVRVGFFGGFCFFLSRTRLRRYPPYQRGTRKVVSRVEITFLVSRSNPQEKNLHQIMKVDKVAITAEK